MVVEFLLDLLGFVLKGIVVLAVIIIPVMTILSFVSRNKKGGQTQAKGALVVEDLKLAAKKRKEMISKSLKRSNPDKLLNKEEIKVGLKKEEKKKKPAVSAKEKVQEKLDERAAFLKTIEEKKEAGVFCPRNLYVIDFRGSAKGTEFKDLRLKIDAILDVATPEDEVIVNLMSPGGLVNSYGLCASQLQRIRDRGITLTVTVDEVAASGGYLMACVANKIVAAPFSYIGSIGVIAGIPNFRRLINKYDVDYEQITAGKFKRTLSVFGENTEEGRAKFKEELEAVHTRFKEQVLRYRPHLDADKVTTGEHWLAVDAKELGLVDEIATSDEYIKERMGLTIDSALKIKWKKQEKKNLISKFLPKSALSKPIFGMGIDPVESAQKLEEHDNTYMNMR
ncbi:MAG: protease SohB [Anaerobiospirillum succiniciproducens]|uniref:protease SohB n=1 Tax=Anaerobiospirillum succiniciproducens TaxID=13335 RepID=UPI002355F71D|nr:protease SohB [Anaerobiospirillum succiniciproducens]MCI6863017.1 protease SohB [Anaerobiospirillum succiniciproducens]MDY2799609.1 protease SohB [Anaerobiospirillum succiniciproducens]